MSWLVFATFIEVLYEWLFRKEFKAFIAYLKSRCNAHLCGCSEVYMMFICHKLNPFIVYNFSASTLVAVLSNSMLFHIVFSVWQNQDMLLL